MASLLQMELHISLVLSPVMLLFIPPGSTWLYIVPRDRWSLHWRTGHPPHFQMVTLHSFILVTSTSQRPSYIHSASLRLYHLLLCTYKSLPWPIMLVLDLHFSSTLHSQHIGHPSSSFWPSSFVIHIFSPSSLQLLPTIFTHFLHLLFPPPSGHPWPHLKHFPHVH